MPPALPNAPACGTPRPAPPQNPPTLGDIADAIEYNRLIQINHLGGVATRGDVGRGAIYEATLIQENAGLAVAPPWFQGALNAGLRPLVQIASRTFNLLCGDGLDIPFQMVPFANGDDPTDHPHNLPALMDVGDIRGLTGRQATAYLVGYNRPVPPNVNARKNAMRGVIGCTAGL